jgi:predicted permease
LSEEVWRKLYASDPRVIGKSLSMRGIAYTILGVMPKGFSFPFGSEMYLWTPEPLSAANSTAMSSESEMDVWGSMYARIPDGMTEAQLTAALSRAQAVIAKEVPKDDLPTRVNVTRYQQTMHRDTRKPLTLLYAVVLGIWALACLNVTSLMLARAVSRSREQAMRAALGASRLRLMQQTIVESFLLSSIGAVFGLLLGQTAIELLWRQIQRSLHLSVTDTIHLDWRVVACLAALTLVTAVVIGAFPALRAMRRDMHSSLRDATATASASQNRTREVLVVAQLALTLVFLAGAGLFLRTIYALRSVPLGFTQQNVLTSGILLHQPEQENPKQGDNDAAHSPANVILTTYLPLLERLRAIPGVQAAALSTMLPMRPEFLAFDIIKRIDHRDLDLSTMSEGSVASSGLVEALGIPMLRGRFFTEEDTASAPRVVVVNQAFVNRFFNGRDPIGHTITLDNEMRIVGVIGDMKQDNVTHATKPEMFFCLAQLKPGVTPLPFSIMQVAVRGAIPANLLRVPFEKALHEVAPDATTIDVKTIHEAVEDSFGSQTLIAHLLESFAGLALMIASVGLYGLLSFTVAQRTREIGLRIALGAPQGNILSLILRRALALVAVGSAIGGVLAWFAVKLTRSYIWGVHAHDGLTFAVVVVVLALASFIAAWLPARRAASVDPILALRSE